MDLKNLRLDLIEDEGLKLKPYQDSFGKTTIGVGRNLDDVGLSQEEVFYLLDHDIQRVVVDCQKCFGDWLFRLNDARKNVVFNMVFNMGVDRFRGFKNFIAALQRGDFESAANEMLTSRWASQVGKRAVKLSELMRIGDYPDPLLQ